MRAPAISTLAIASMLAFAGTASAQVNGSGGHFSNNGSKAGSTGMTGGSGTGTGGSATGDVSPGSTAADTNAARHDAPSPNGVGAAGTTETQPGRIIPPAAAGPN